MKTSIEWFTFVAVCLGTWLLAGPASLGGPANYVIVDGRSMEPTYGDGDLVIAYQRDEYEVDDVIVYDAPVDSQFDVIHRIVDTTEGGFITQGDNRDEVDGWIAPHDDIHGAALFHVPHGGQAVLFLRQPTTILAIGAGWITLVLMKRREDDERDDGDDSEADHPAACEDGDTSVDTADESLTVSSSAIATRPSRAATMRAKRARSRTVALLGVAALVGGTAGVLVAHAATLHVNAGVLQVFSEQVHIDIPEPATYLVTVQAHFFDSSNQDDEAGGEIGTSPRLFEPVDVTAGQTYTITWNGPGNSSVVDCDNEGLEFHEGLPDHDHSGEVNDDPVMPTGDVTHLLCIQTAPGNVPDNIDFHVSNGDGTHVTLTPVDDDEMACEDEDDGDCADDPSPEGNLDVEEEPADDTPGDLQVQDGGPDEDDADEDTDPSQDQEESNKADDPDSGQEGEGDLDADEQGEPDDDQADDGTEDQTDDSDDGDDLDDAVEADDGSA